jgi:hypothetical protein
MAVEERDKLPRMQEGGSWMSSMTRGAFCSGELINDGTGVYDYSLTLLICVYLSLGLSFLLVFVFM